MSIINDDDLILYILDELPEQERLAVKAQILASDELQGKVAELEASLGATDNWKTEIDPGFDQRLWNGIEANLPGKAIFHEPREEQSNNWFGWFTATLTRPTFVYSAMVVAVFLAFMGGRIIQHQEMVDNPEQVIASLDDQARHNILMQSVTHHFEKTSRLMTSVAVSNQSELGADEKAWAMQLLDSNRLFKTAAQAAGQWRIVSLLEELEPILIEMANADDSQLSSRQSIKQRIDNKGLVFKTRHFSAGSQPAI